MKKALVVLFSAIVVFVLSTPAIAQRDMGSGLSVGNGAQTDQPKKETKKKKAPKKKGDAPKKEG